jgi:hypothetical protein
MMVKLVLTKLHGKAHALVSNELATCDRENREIDFSDVLKLLVKNSPNNNIIVTNRSSSPLPDYFQNKD